MRAGRVLFRLSVTLGILSPALKGWSWGNGTLPVPSTSQAVFEGGQTHQFV